MSGRIRSARAGKRPSSVSQPGTEPVRSIAPAAVADVMFDQLEYLASHAVGNCPRDCADCARLGRVKTLLLLPFLSGPGMPGPDMCL
jgi:hypothetical protein